MAIFIIVVTVAVTCQTFVLQQNAANAVKIVVLMDDQYLEAYCNHLTL
jgi:hypothetical protein